MDYGSRFVSWQTWTPLNSIQVSQSQELQQNLCVAAHLAHVSFAELQLANGTVGPR
jgi:hypothetical protein